MEDSYHSSVTAVKNNPILIMTGVLLSGWDYYVKHQVNDAAYWHRFINLYDVSAQVSLLLLTVALKEGFKLENLHKVLAFILLQSPMSTLAVLRSPSSLQRVKDNPEGCMFDGESSDTMVSFKKLLPLLKQCEKIREEPHPGKQFIHEQLTLGLFQDKSGKLARADPRLLGTTPSQRLMLTYKDIQAFEPKYKSLIMEDLEESPIWAYNWDIPAQLMLEQDEPVSTISAIDESD